MGRPEINCVVLGAGGHAKIVLDALQAAAEPVRVAGLLDADPALKGRRLMGHDILGADSLLAELAQGGLTHFVLGVASVGDTALKRRLFEKGLQAGLKPLTVVHPSALVSPYAVLGPGCQVLARAVIGPMARLGENAQINTGAIVEHDCRVGSHAHVATGAVVCGFCTLGAGVHVGAGAVLRQGIEMGEGALAAAGAVVVKNVGPGQRVAGCPAAPMGKNG